MAAISRLVRRACLLREQGNAAEADELESIELAEAVRAHREAYGSASLNDVALREMFDREGNRVVEAQILCELLVPRLTPAMPAAGRVPPPRRIVERVAPPRDDPPDAGSPEIPELLDAMLAAERTGRRTTQLTRPKT